MEQWREFRVEVQAENRITWRIRDIFQRFPWLARFLASQVNC